MGTYVSAPSAAPTLVAAVDWVADLFTGTVGTSLAVLAIAWLGFALLQGRIPVRDGARIIMGCFILFGAPVIAAAFVQMARPEQSALSPVVVQAVPPPVVTPARPPVFDPYAGASVPNH